MNGCCNVSQSKFVAGFGMAFKICRFKPTNAVPDDGVATTVVPRNFSEHFIVITINDNL